MKPKKFEKKLTLNKKTISALQNREMNEVHGGKTGGPTACYGTYCASTPYCIC
jgi:natural product precursor